MIFVKFNYDYMSIGWAIFIFSEFLFCYTAKYFNYTIFQQKTNAFPCFLKKLINAFRNKIRTIHVCLFFYINIIS